MMSLRRLAMATALSFSFVPAYASGIALAPHQARHVLLLSVDGMHAVDLARWVAGHPDSTLAHLAARGTTFTQAYTTGPSDSFPGMLAQITGGSPSTTGVYYDDTYDRQYFPPGSDCKGPAGTEVDWTERMDRSLDAPDAGGTLRDPISQLDRAKLPMHMVGGTCTVVYPHDYLRVNTVFEVLRQHGRHTAWSDKHPVYEIVNGPSGKGVEDLYTPEVDARVPGTPAGNSFGKSFNAIRAYDAMKVTAVLNEIDGRASTGGPAGYVPALFGMNFQAVSVGEKLAHGGLGDPAGLTGGYRDAAGTPGDALAGQIAFVDGQIGRIVAALKSHHLYQDTVIIVGAKHGQAPIDPAARRTVKDPFPALLKNDGYAFSVADDIGLIWLRPAQRTAATLQAARAALDGAPSELGIKAVFDRTDMPGAGHVPGNDSRAPDFMVIPRDGLIYTGGSKLSEHGGVSDDDRHVALLVSAPGLSGGHVDQKVATRQIAPTILAVFDIAPTSLQAVKTEHTPILPGLLR